LRGPSQGQLRPDRLDETGLQGATTTAERVSGLSELGFQCNLELVGQYQGQGLKYMLTWFGDCVYMAKLTTPTFFAQWRRGDRRVRAAASTSITWLDSPTMRDPHEGLEVHERRRILAATQFWPGYGFAVYDLSGDCRNPRLASSIVLPRNPNTNPDAGADGGHAGSLSPDGNTTTAPTPFAGVRGIVSIVDLSDINNAKSLMEYQYPGDGRGHDYGFSPDGMTMYANQPGQSARRSPGRHSAERAGGSRRQRRSTASPQSATPRHRHLLLAGRRSGAAGSPHLVQGKPYLIMTDEGGAGGTGGREGACARGVNGISGLRGSST